MMTTNLHFLLLHVCISGLSLTALGQVRQTHPELCGRPNDAVIVPRSISAVESDAGPVLTVESGSSVRRIELNGVDEVRQVCPAPGTKLVVFGFIAGAGAYRVEIVDTSNGSQDDAFWAYDPVMSPDRRWLAYRSFYAPQSEVSLSEEYLVYDLGKDSSSNRIAHPESGMVEDRGRVMYPAVPDAIPFNNLGLPKDQIHHFRAATFFWAPDSGSVVFADENRARLSLVWVIIKSDSSPTPFVYTPTANEVCASVTAEDTSPLPVTLSSAEIRSRLDASPVLVGDMTSATSACVPKQFTLAFAAFQPAATERHPAPVSKKPAVKRNRSSSHAPARLY
jgi:hypothetical protein